MIEMLRMSRVFGALAAAALGLAGLSGAGRTAAAEPLVTQGIGTSSCARLAADLKPADGLANPINLVLYAWVQGYVSAANIALLEDGGKHIDMSTLDEHKVLYDVFAFCSANPDGKPVTAIDEMIRATPKLQGKWEPGTVAWDE
jgi:hypothetical protein